MLIDSSISEESGLVVIPARLDSSRLPRKILRTIHGKPMVALTYARVRKSLNLDVVVAVDCAEVEDTLKALKIPTILTSAECANGTERVYEVSKKLSQYQYYVNVQADEPLLNPLSLNEMIRKSKPERGFNCAVSVCHSLDDSTEVKVAISSDYRIRYCSRAMIPHQRDAKTGKESTYKILGIYVYSKEVLEAFVTLPNGPLEKLEKVEQLRCIENDIPIYAVVVPETERSVDTQRDFDEISKYPKSMFTF